jgi:hypothetical protein
MAARHKQGLESTYGAAASIVIVLIWVYSAQIVLFGGGATPKSRWPRAASAPGSLNASSGASGAASSAAFGARGVLAKGHFREVERPSSS